MGDSAVSADPPTLVAKFYASEDSTSKTKFTLRQTCPFERFEGTRDQLQIIFKEISPFRQFRCRMCLNERVTSSSQLSHYMVKLGRFFKASDN